MNNIPKLIAILSVALLTMSCNRSNGNWKLLRSGKNGTILESQFHYANRLTEMTSKPMETYFKLYCKDKQLYIDISMQSETDEVPMQTAPIAFYNYQATTEGSKCVTLTCKDGGTFIVYAQKNRVEVWLFTDFYGIWILNKDGTTSMDNAKALVSSMTNGL